MGRARAAPVPNSSGQENALGPCVDDLLVQFLQDLSDSPHLTSAEIGRESEMMAQHKPPYLRRLRFAADPFWFRPEPLLDPSSFLFIVGHSMHLMQTGKKRLSCGLGSLRPLNSPSADSDTEESLLERGAEALPFTQGRRSTTSTDADAVPSS